MKLEELLGAELYAQVAAKIDEANAGETDKTKHIRFADLSEGGYVSRSKYDDKVNGLSQQVSDLESQISQRDTDLAGLNEKLAAAKADAGKLTEAQGALAALQSKYDADSKAWAAKSAEQAREYAIRALAEQQSFQSKTAKKGFIQAAIADKGLKLDGDTVLGYTAFLEKFKAEDPGAFTPEKKEPEGDDDEGKKKPVIVLPGKAKPKTKKLSLTAAMKAKNENPDYVVTFDE